MTGVVHLFGAEAAAVHLRAALAYQREIEAVGLAHGVPGSLIAAIGSRETHWDRLLFLGDKRDPKTGKPSPTGEPHGFGPLQVDVGTDPSWCRAWLERWRRGDPGAMHDAIERGVEILLLKRANLIDTLTPTELAGGVLAAYNTGEGNILRAIAHGQPVDWWTEHSAGHLPDGSHRRPGDYSSDVLARASFFEAHGFETTACLANWGGA